ncbi:MAG: hypothetical protein ACLPN1_07905 [Dissulfurispiraceae bacterium]
MDIEKLKRDLKLDEIRKLLLNRISVHGESIKSQNLFEPEINVEAKISLKIDLLERILELLRYDLKHFENRLGFERFIQGSISIDADRLQYTFPENPQLLGSGTPSIRLQTKLLMFLLLHHRSAYHVFDIIDNFIKTIWGQLAPLDFKKTRTGVTRCFTNTRFAANTLRDYGFIKFTNKEAYKTWVLSLSGFLVASKIVTDKNWGLPQGERIYKSDLHPDIHLAYENLKTYDHFVERLSAICIPNVTVFKTFGSILHRAYSLMEQYRHALKDMSMSLKDRKKKSLELITQLEREPNIEDFYKEFSACINVENLLKSLNK